MITDQRTTEPTGENPKLRLQAARARHVHTARLCLLFITLVMGAGSLISTLMLDDSPALQRAGHLLLRNWHTTAMLGCLLWSRQRPAVALSVAAAILVGVIGPNLLDSGGGAARLVGFGVVTTIVIVLLRGARSGLTIARAARTHADAIPAAPGQPAKGDEGAPLKGC